VTSRLGLPKGGVPVCPEKGTECKTLETLPLEGTWGRGEEKANDGESGIREVVPSGEAWMEI